MIIVFLEILLGEICLNTSETYKGLFSRQRRFYQSDNSNPLIDSSFVFVIRKIRLRQSMSGLENDDVSSKKKRKRSMVSVACENCRSSHLRCDGTTRCSHCCRKNLTCTYSESKRRGRKPIKESSPKKKESIGEVHKDSWKLPTNSPTSNLQSLYDAATGQKMSPTSMINPFAGVQSICIPNYLTIPFAPSQASIQAVITRHIEIYTSYCSFLFPQLQMPLSNHITTQKLHDLAYYAILSLGILFCALL